MDPMSSHRQVYSVPYTLVGKKVKLIYTADTVEIYDHYSRIALHVRQLTAHGYSTHKPHLPPNQQWVSDWSVDYFVQEASRIGVHTQRVIEELLTLRPYPQQAYKSCAGVLSLEKKYGTQRLERACYRALLYQAISYRLLCSILDNQLDRLETPPLNQREETILEHENIRGSAAYQ